MTEPVESASYTNSECQHGCISRKKLDLLKSILEKVNGTAVDIIKTNVKPIIAELEKRIIKRVGTGIILQEDKELLEFLQTVVEEEIYTLPANPETFETLILDIIEKQVSTDETKIAQIKEVFQSTFTRTKSKPEGKFIQDEREELKKNLEALNSLLRQKAEITEFEAKKEEIFSNLQTIIEDLGKVIKKISDDTSDKTRNFNEFQKIYNKTYQALGANQTQQYELGSFLYKDPSFSDRFSVLKNGENGENIDITDITVENGDKYLMVKDGGIQKFESDKNKFEDCIYFIAQHKIGFKQFDLSKDRKISRLSQNDLLDFVPVDLQALKINAKQTRELAAFLNYDRNFKATYNIAEKSDEIIFTEKSGENNEYIMRKDGGIVKMSGSEPVNYIYDISDTTKKNIKFRKATLGDGTNRLLQNRQGWWGGKTKKRRKNKRKRRKTRRK